MARNWYPHYMGDYIRDTAHLSLAQHGAYRLLLDHYYATGRELPAKLEDLYRLVRANTKEERAAVSIVVTEFFRLGEKGFAHGRVIKELEKMGDVSEERRKSGANGNAKRWQTHRKKIANASDEKSQMREPDDPKRDRKSLAIPQPHPDKAETSLSSVALQAKQSLSGIQAQSLAADALGLEGRASPPLSGLEAIRAKYGSH